VVLRPGRAGSVESAADLQAHCRQALAYYKSPGYIGFCTALPQTASQKLARAQIKQLAASAVASGAACDLRHLKRR
jgi:acyl-coenzyme A synthetase/AMP-(fatty) acid ligase